MTQAQFERELARQTGESRATIRDHGFQLLEPPELKPLVVDWDALDRERVSVLPQRSRQRQTA